MKHTAIISLITANLIVLSACNITETKTTDKTINFTNNEQTIKSNSIHYESVKNSKINYAYYLPDNYDSTKKYPVIFFFDSHAKGSFPIEKYKKITSQYNYITVGSNNSKNGLPQQEYSQIISSTFKDVISKFQIDTARIYAMGFSGGARIAILSAYETGKVKGVVACGASFPYQPSGKLKFNFLGIVGNQDFNYLEFETLKPILDKIHANYQITNFNGIHEWPSDSIFEEAILWFECNAMKNNLIPKNDETINRTISIFEHQITNHENSNNFYFAYIKLLTLINYINNLTDITGFSKKINDLKNKAEVKNSLKETEDLKVLELAIQKSYYSAFQAKDTIWWTSELKNIEQKCNKNTLRGQLFYRIKNFLGIMCYSNCNAATKQGNISLLKTTLFVYKNVSENNPDYYYFSACLNGLLNNRNATIENLSKAIELGFNDIAQIQNEYAFNQLKGTREFSDLLSNIQ